MLLCHPRVRPPLFRLLQLFFQQKIFGASDVLLQVSNLQSRVITMNLSLVGWGLPSGSNLIYVETSNMTPDFGNNALLELASTTPPNTSQQIDKESHDRAHTCLMEGMHFLNEVSACTRICAQILASKQLHIEEFFQAMKNL
ncbi:unnamed protein product [Lactuca virosa]|uniref:Uncharacterized protein n=1 Tax=Lactuca virosa TaxID=75947 RepID=A0AAU9P0V9_9ASTR|nr:unnamed protein product [Lactuca virosa]